MKEQQDSPGFWEQDRVKEQQQMQLGGQGSIQTSGLNLRQWTGGDSGQEKTDTAEAVKV